MMFALFKKKMFVDLITKVLLKDVLLNVKKTTLIGSHAALFNETLLEILQFMEEEPLFLEDFLINEQVYLARLLHSYTNQHVHNFGGSSSKKGPKAIHYTKNISSE